MDLLFKTKFGSHLYGLNTPSSDTDYKGIYMPTLSQLLLGTWPKSIRTSTGTAHTKNTSEDIDEEYYALPYFIKLAVEGDTTALDMLHANKSSTLVTSPLWEELKSRRKEFYSRDMKALVGYVMHQAAKYGMKGTRLATMQDVLNKSKHLVGKLRDVVHLLPQNEYCKVVLEPENAKQQPYYEVCGKKFLLNAQVQDLQFLMQEQLDKYGERARLAQANEGVDWKALSHALRVAYQMKSVYEDGDFEYPLKQSHFLRLVKAGEVDFSEVKQVLESTLERVEELAKFSYMKEKVNRATWDQWLLDKYWEEYFRSDK